MKNLKDKVAIVTGAARGIGFSIAKGLFNEGAKVYILDLNEETVNEAIKEIDENSENINGFSADVTDENKIKTIFKQIFKENKRIDILINNAGITNDTLLMRMSEKAWDSVMNVNLKGTFNCTKNVARFMMKNKTGSIINIASVIGIMGNAGQANYAASKGGIIAFTKSAAKEFSSRNIRANSIAPGFIETEMTKKLDKEVVENYAKSIPLNRMGKPEDIADLCVFLASDKSKYITGQTINVDGGLIM